MRLESQPAQVQAVGSRHHGLPKYDQTNDSPDAEWKRKVHPGGVMMKGEETGVMAEKILDRSTRHIWE